MIIERMTIRNFRGIRNIEDLAFQKVNVILGVNASGKTSLLLAVSMLNAALISEKIGTKDLFSIPFHSPHGWFIGIKYSDIMRRISSSSRTLVHMLDDFSRIEYSTVHGEIKVEISERGTIETYGVERLNGLIGIGETLCFLPMDEIIDVYISLMSTNNFWEYMQREKLHIKVGRILSDIMPTYISEIVPPLSINGRQILGVRIESGAEETYYLPVEDLSTATKKVLTLLILNLVMKPKLLIIDDIDAFLDTQTLKGLIRYLLQENPPQQIILSTHSLSTLVGVAELMMKEAEAIVLQKSREETIVMTYDIYEAVEHIEKGIDIRIVPPEG